jgi:hypothetical protein
VILTRHIHEFREALRHLWNAYMRLDATWDTAEEFAEIAQILFVECVLGRAGVEARSIPMDHGSEVLTEYRLFADHQGKLPLHANRDIPASGYWDHPVSWIPPEQKQVIHPICFFDFDQLGWRRIQYYRVRIVESSSNPDLNGRDALIECQHVDLEIPAAERAAAADRGSDRD